MCGCTRGPIRTGHEQNCNQKAVKSGFKTDGGLDGAHAEVHTVPGQVTPALLIRDRRKQTVLKAAGGWAGLCGMGMQEAPLSSSFSSDRPFFSLKTPRLLLPLCCLSTLSLLLHLCPLWLLIFSHVGRRSTILCSSGVNGKENTSS